MNNSTEQPSSWSGLNKDNYNHTERNDPYFSPEQASKRGPERHPSGYNFLGPGTEFAARMIGSDFYKQMIINAGRPLVGTEPYNVPINELDRCAFEHDAVFTRNNNTEKKIRDADIKFRECSDKIKDPKLKYYALIQFSKSVIGLKEFGEDMGFIKPELYANINKNINDLNLTLAKNHTIPSTKEEQQQEDRNFYIFTLLSYLRVPFEFMIPIATRIGTDKLLKKIKSLNIDLMTIVPGWAKPVVEFVVNRLIGRRNFSVITKEITNLATSQIVTFIKGVITDTDLFGTGVSGLFLKYGYTQVVQFLIDNFLIRLSTQWGSNAWRERNIMTREELEQIAEGRDPAILEATMKANTEFTKNFDLSIQNVRVREIVDIFNDNINNLSNREKIARFGNFNRAIIQLRNKLGPNKSIFNIIYILLNGTIKNSLVADITVDRLRTILNQKISRDDFDTILSRNRVVENFEEYYDFPIDGFQNYTYMEFINYILNAITTKNLGDLLS